MSHVPDDLLQNFVDGEIDEQLAVHIAEHVDSCPSCSTRAAGLEPLGIAFAAASDPTPPPDLAARILAAAEEPERLPLPEIGIGLALLASAAVLAGVGTGDPLTLVADLVVAAQALAAMGRGIGVAMGSFQLALAATTAFALAGGVLTLRYAALPPAPDLLAGSDPDLRRAP